MFHEKYPVGTKIDGETAAPADRKELPVYAQQSLDKFTLEVLVPLYSGKKHSVLGTQAHPGHVPFVYANLNDLDELYKQECTMNVANLPAASLPKTGPCEDAFGPLVHPPLPTQNSVRPETVGLFRVLR